MQIVEIKNESQKSKSELSDYGFIQPDHKQLMRTHDVANLIGISFETIYDWKYRAKQKNVPEGMFLKINQMLLVRTDLLKCWLLSKSSGI